MPLHRAKPEVLVRSDAEIEGETAMTWLQRSLDCYTLYRHTQDLDWLLRARSAEDEALEHGALVRDQGKTVKTIEKLLRDAQHAPVNWNRLQFRRKPR